MEEDLEEKPSVFKRIFIIALASFLLIIVLVYFLTNPIVRDIISGLIESSSLEGYETDIDSNSRLIFDGNSHNKLMELYDNNLEKEFKVCLKGKILNSNYHINEIYEPEMFLQTHNQVLSEPCPSDSLVSMHSHPLKHCLPSQQDLKNFDIFKRNNPDALMAVMCERGRFNFYS